MDARRPAYDASPRLSNLSDALLIDLCLDGDEDAWAELVERYTHCIYFVATQKYHFSQADAEDLAQEIWVKVALGLPRLREPSAFPSWLRLVATHHVHDAARRRAARATVSTEREWALECTPIPNLERILELDEACCALRTILAEMGPPCAPALEHAYLRTPPATHDQVAEATGLPRGSVKYHLERCLRRLRQRLRALGWGRAELPWRRRTHV